MSVSIRTFTLEDLPGITDLWNSTVWADPINARRLLSDFVLDPSFSADHVLVAEEGEQLVGFVWGMIARDGVPGDNAPGSGVIVAFGVAESHRRIGVGTRLFAELEASWNVGRVQIGPWIPTYLAPGVDEQAYPEAVPFLREIGFETAGRPVSMRALLTGYKAAPDVAEIAAAQIERGIGVRPAESTDALGLIAFAREHFPHWEGYIRDALVTLVERPREGTLHIAHDDDRVLGFALSNGERFGPFGVDETCRGQGIGAVLLSQTLQAMRANGTHVAYFLWTSDQTARLYGRHGFEIVRRFTMVSRTNEEEK